MTVEKLSPAQKAQLWGFEAFIFEQEVPLFQPLLKLSLRALDCSLSTGYLKKVLPSFTLLRSKGTLSVYKASPVSSCLPAPLSH